MFNIKATVKKETPIVVGIFVLLLFGTVILHSIAKNLFPLQYLYLVLAIVLFYFLSKVDFDIIALFSKYLYIGSIILLVLPLLIGQITRGTVRWIPIGALTIQPSEIVRPFLFIFFAHFLADKELTLKRLGQAVILFIVPFFLIFIQPSFSVAVLSAIGFLGIIFASTINKKTILFIFLGAVVFLPLVWTILVPYQRERISSFLSPANDPYGAGYNSLQSKIAVGSGGILGLGLGKGIQTQLAYLPERQTDFIFASTAEELGFVGAAFLIVGLFYLLFCLTGIMENAQSPAARAYVSAFTLTLFVQIVIHIGMNMGLLPITGVPLPLVSAGGSSLIGTMIGFAIAIGARK
jgi:rod shape determining protein RodA